MKTQTGIINLIRNLFNMRTSIVPLTQLEVESLIINGRLEAIPFDGTGDYIVLFQQPEYEELNPFMKSRFLVKR